MANKANAGVSLWAVCAATHAAGAPLSSGVPWQRTAEQALAASRALTSIGPDPCRTSAAGEEIVVCGQRESPYTLPLYEPAVSDDGVTGREREDMVATTQDTAAGCHSRGESCLKPLPILKVPFGRGTKSGIGIGED